jgi:hypothetical protein
LKRIKGHSSRKLRQEYVHLRKRQEEKTLRARGYICAASGRTPEEQIRNYIKEHDREPPDLNFTVEEWDLVLFQPSRSSKSPRLPYAFNGAVYVADID